MWTAWSLAAFFTLAGAGTSCKHKIPVFNYYAELGCLPVFGKDPNCPIEYNCTASRQGREIDSCYLYGKVYEAGSLIKGIDFQACVGSTCQCDQGVIDCPWSYECPEYEMEMKDNCEHQYEKGVCCPTGQRCFDAVVGEGACRYDNKKYALGQHIYQFDDPCKSCVCQKDFDGTLEGPWCSNVNCYYELYDSDKIEYGCVPVVHQTPTCCSDEWRCPSVDDEVIENYKPKPATSSTCKFGELTLRIGDGMSKDRACVHCFCDLPPDLTCARREDCSETLI